MAAISGVRGGPRGGYARRRRLIVVGAGALVALAVVLAFVFGPNRNSTPEKFSAVPATRTPVETKAPLSKEARHVAIRFVQTAVARKNLAEAWTLVGPNLRGGLSRKQWLTGNNPVVPYPAAAIDYAPYKIDYSYTNSALLEVALLAKKTAKIKSQLFMLQLKKIGSGATAHWVVDNWVPRSVPVVPQQ